MNARRTERAPLWEPGTGYAYHALTHGWLAGELVRRVTGHSPGDYLHTVLTGPLGADFWLGFPTEERQRLAPMTFPPELIADGVGFNDVEVLAAQVPGAGGVGTARALAGRPRNEIAGGLLPVAGRSGASWFAWVP